MENKELKIGDLIEWDGRHCIVDCIPEDVCRVVATDYIATWFAPVKDLNPIQLTEEILRKNGWVEEPKYREWKHPLRPNICLAKWYGTDGTKYWGFGAGTDVTYIHDIRYVHELQHILSALGKDDNIIID